MILGYLNTQDKENTEQIFWLLLKEINSIIYVLEVFQDYLEDLCMIVVCSIVIDVIHHLGQKKN